MKIIISACLFCLSFQWAVAQSFLENPFQSHYLNNTTRYSSISFLGNAYYDGIGREYLLNELPSSVITGYTTQFVPKSVYNPLFGNLTMNTKGGSYPIELSIQGSQQGEQQGQFSSRLLKRKKGTWEMNNLFDGYRYNGDLDKNDDGFQDLMNKNRIVALHSNSFKRGRFQTTLLAHYIKSDATGGEVDYDKETDYFSNSVYGFGNEVENIGLTSNTNINLTKSGSTTNRRLNINANGLQHKQLNFSGIKSINNEEQFLNSSVTYSQKMSLSNFSIGAMYRFQDIEATDKGLYDDKLLYLYTFNTHRFSGFASYNGFFGAATQFKSGVRVDYENEKVEIYPRLQLDFAISKGKESSEDLGYLSFFAAREKRLALVHLEYQEYLNSGRAYNFRVDSTFNDSYDRGWSTGASFTFNEFEFEIPWFWEYMYVYNTKILWRSVLFEESTDVNISPTDHSPIGSVVFMEDETFSAQHWIELASSFRFQRFHTHLNYRINNLGVNNQWLVPNTSLAISSKYSFNFGMTSMIRFIFQGKQALNNGTTSPCNYRLDLRNDFSLEQYWSNYFTDNATFSFGINNILHQRQQYQVRNGGAPFSSLYDGSQIWGNTVGFQIYAGMKFNVRW